MLHRTFEMFNCGRESFKIAFESFLKEEQIFINFFALGNMSSLGKIITSMDNPLARRLKKPWDGR